MRTPESRQQESVEAVLDGAGYQFAERSAVSTIRPIECVQVLLPVLLVDDRWRELMTDEQQVEYEAARSAVPVAERMDAFELRMHARQVLDERLSLFGFGVGEGQPVGDLGRDVREVRWGHAAGKGSNVVLAEAAWRFTWKQFFGRFHLPCRFDDAPMDLTQLRQGDVRIATLGVTVAGLRVDPLGGIGVALHLEVLRQLLVADRLARVEEPAHLLEQERVSLDRGRVVGFFVPDIRPDVPGHVRTGKASDPVQLRCRLLDRRVYGQPGGPAPAGLRDHHMVRRTSTKWTVPAMLGGGTSTVKKTDRTNRQRCQSTMLAKPDPLAIVGRDRRRGLIG